jgi:uncharacterized membrane protein YdjX (TVP38/TMEM64 family)
LLFLCKYYNEYKERSSMMSFKKLIKLTIALLWICIGYALYNNNIITLNKDLIIMHVKESPYYGKILFTFLASARVFMFIPGVLFMIVGGVLFGPFTGFFLSMTAMVISESLIYFISKIFDCNELKEILFRKYPYIGPLIKEYDYRFLSLGIITPIAPTDIICFLSGLSGIKYKKYITTVVITNIPMMLLYNSMGDSFGNSVGNTLLLIFSLIICGSVSIQIWFKLKNRMNKEFLMDQTSTN